MSLEGGVLPLFIYRQASDQRRLCKETRPILPGGMHHDDQMVLRVYTFGMGGGGPSRPSPLGSGRATATGGKRPAGRRD